MGWYGLSFLSFLFLFHSTTGVLYTCTFMYTYTYTFQYTLFCFSQQKGLKPLASQSDLDHVMSVHDSLPHPPPSLKIVLLYEAPSPVPPLSPPHLSPSSPLDSTPSPPLNHNTVNTHTHTHTHTPYTHVHTHAHTHTHTDTNLIVHLYVHQTSTYQWL